MGLSIDRSIGEAFTLTYPSGQITTVECINLDAKTCRVDGLIRQLPLILIGSVKIRAQNQHSNSHIKFNIEAPANVRILRDDAKRKEKRA